MGDPGISVIYALAARLGTARDATKAIDRNPRQLLNRIRGRSVAVNLDDTGLLDRLTGKCEGYDDALEPNIPSIAKRKRKPSLAAALRQAAATGVTVSGATIKPDGSVALTFGERDEAATNGNPWDEVLTNAAH